jgi:hypothetical protein
MFHSDEISPAAITNLTYQLNDWLGQVIDAGLISKSKPTNSPLEAPGVNESLEIVVAGSDYRLGESFIVYTLDVDTIESLDSQVKDLRDLVRPTDRRHHQVRVDQKPIAFSRTIISQQETVSQFFISKLAEDIQKAMAWIDDYEKKNPDYSNTDPLVRLLTIPEYNLTAFWIYKLRRPKSWTSIFKKPKRESNVLIISAPSELEKLKKEVFLNTRQFLQAFAGHSPIAGLG